MFEFWSRQGFLLPTLIINLGHVLWGPDLRLRPPPPKIGPKIEIGLLLSYSIPLVLAIIAFSNALLVRREEIIQEVKLGVMICTNTSSLRLEVGGLILYQSCLGILTFRDDTIYVLNVCPMSYFRCLKRSYD